MKSRRQLELHRHGLGEIRDIMNAMKNLAYMETRKLARFLDAQQAVVASIEEAAGDFLEFYPETLPASVGATPVYLLIGAERGFCGDFVHPLVDQLEQAEAVVGQAAQPVRTAGQDPFEAARAQHAQGDPQGHRRRGDEGRRGEEGRR